MNKQNTSFFRKKTALARAFYSESYDFKLNDRAVSGLDGKLLYKLFAPLKMLEKIRSDLYLPSVEIISKMHLYTRNGGASSQLSAARGAMYILLGRKLDGVKPILKAYKLFTRDLRRSERTKPGISGSRVRPPFNKR